MMQCTLCESLRLSPVRAANDATVYFHCADCDLHFMDPAQRLRPADENARYDLHQCPVGDPGYARFIAPLINRLGQEVPLGAHGLDFGAGRVPALARALEDQGYVIALYDAFYWPDVGALERTYDFIVSCEVVEHLYDPRFEFARLRELLRPGAPLVLMTQCWHGRDSFHAWAYRRDPTHVSFYTPKTFRWIGERYGFKTVDVDARVVCLR